LVLLVTEITVLATTKILMADEFLQAFNIGASLYDRAQTQKRMTEQLQLQTAQQLMQQKSADIQNKIHENALGQSLKEQETFAVDLPKIQKWQSEYVQWNAKGDPTAAFPAPPSDLQSATGLKMLGDMSKPVIDSLPLSQNRFLLEKANASQFESLNNEIKFLNEHGKSDIPLQYNGGLDPKTGKINPESRIAIFAAAAPLREKEKAQKDVNLIANLAKLPDASIDVQVANGTYTQEQGDAAKELSKRGLTGGERLIGQFSSDAVAQARNSWGSLSPEDEDQIKALAETKQWKAPSGEDNKMFLANKSIARTSDELVNKIDAYEKQYPGKLNGYIGLIGGNIAKLDQKFSEAKTDQDKKAYEILQYASKNFNSTALARSGKAVTSGEQGRLVSELGDLKSGNFINAAKNFAAFSALDYAHNINDFKTKYKLTPLEVKQADVYRTKYNLSAFEPFVNNPQPGTTAPAAPSVGQPAGGGALPAGWGFKQ
jgi:hypothetical protein